MSNDKDQPTLVNQSVQSLPLAATIEHFRRDDARKASASSAPYEVNVVFTGPEPKYLGHVVVRYAKD